MGVDSLADSPKANQWSIWQKVLAYATLIGVSALAVGFVDLKVHVEKSNGGSVHSMSHSR